MKKLLSILIFLSIIMAGIASADDAQARSVRVKGYYKKAVELIFSPTTEVAQIGVNLTTGAVKGILILILARKGQRARLDGSRIKIMGWILPKPSSNSSPPREDRSLSPFASWIK